MISSLSTANTLLVQAMTQRSEISDGGASVQRHEVSVATTQKPRLEAGVDELFFGPSHATATDNSGTISRFLEKAVGMAKALARLQGTSVHAVMGNIPGGGIMQASSGWAYEAEVEIYESGVVRMSSQLTGTDGDDTLTINTGDASKKDVTAMSAMPLGINAGDGNDALTLASQRVVGVDAGTGDDRAAIDAMFVANIEGGAGNDAIAIASSVVRNVYGGTGADAISIAAHYISNVHGGAGNDAMTLQGDRVFNVNGDDGADAISVTARSADSVSGGAGNDALTVDVRQNAHIRGGEGNDVINARAHGADGNLNISGGSGNDVINIDADMALLRFEGGDGQDQVHINRARDLTISLGTTDLDSASISFDEGTLNIHLEDGSEMSISGLADTPSIRIVSDQNAGYDLRRYVPVSTIL